MNFQKPPRWEFDQNLREKAVKLNCSNFISLCGGPMKIKVSADAEAAQISFQSGDKLNLFAIFLGLYYSQYCFQTLILKQTGWFTQAKG